MSRAGRNTPESVTAYIGTIWHRCQPPDPIELARQLGYSPEAIERLQEKHGDGLLAYLRRKQRQRQEHPRFMARQQGALRPEQYVDSQHGAIDEAEAVDDSTLDDFGRDARRREAQAAAPLFIRITEAREVHKLLAVEAGPLYSRDVHLLNSRLDALERNVRRRHAA